MSFEEYKILLHEFRIESKGKDLHGRLVKQPIETYKTKMGRISPQKWEQEAEKAITAAGQVTLLDSIENYCGNHCMWLKKQEIHHYAIKCLVHGSYLNWQDFDVELKNTIERRKGRNCVN